MCSLCAVIPIWLDEDIEDLHAWLLQRVRRVTSDDDLPETFIKALFREKRFFVVADRLSEKEATTQEAVRNLPSFLNSLVVTNYKGDASLLMRQKKKG